MCVFYFFVFFKQKTAYEMRISDWSSDVCSSDLLAVRLLESAIPVSCVVAGRPFTTGHIDARSRFQERREGRRRGQGRSTQGAGARRTSSFSALRQQRSEEHTSELQSLMRISYAVFCLKNKKKQKRITPT